MPTIDGWPINQTRAAQKQATFGPTERTIDLGNGVTIEMVLIPPGKFVMGDPQGHCDERPLTVLEIDKPFWISKYEITNGQYAQFDPSHDSRHEHKGSWMFNEWDLGWDLNTPKQPVVRVSWKESLAFSRWLSKKTDLAANLPTEAQWEYACRAGTSTPFFYGDLDTDFSNFANMADETIKDLAYDARDQYSPDLVPRDARFNDSNLVATDVGQYKPNAWGLCDMHGNAWEWTRSEYKPYPYSAHDGRNSTDSDGEKVVRGGSWYDRPKRCRSAFRLSYPTWRKLYNVGFRIVLESDKAKPTFVQLAVENH